MPIKPENRRFYEGEVWRQARQRALQRAGNCCAWCRKPNSVTVLQITQPQYLWKDPATGELRDASGEVLPAIGLAILIDFSAAKPVRCVLTTAHYPDSNPENLSDENLWALCQRCHLSADHAMHVENARVTREAKRAKVQPALSFEGATP